MPDIDKAVANYHLDEYYGKALDLITSGKARDAFAIDREDEKMRAALWDEYVWPIAPFGAAPGRSGNARSRSDLAQSGEFRQPFLGHARRADQPDEGPGGANV